MKREQGLAGGGISGRACEKQEQIGKTFHCVHAARAALYRYRPFNKPCHTGSHHRCSARPQLGHARAPFARSPDGMSAPKTERTRKMGYCMQGADVLCVYVQNMQASPSRRTCSPRYSEEKRAALATRAAVVHNVKAHGARADRALARAAAHAVDARQSTSPSTSPHPPHAHRSRCTSTPSLAARVAARGMTSSRLYTTQRCGAWGAYEAPGASAAPAAAVVSCAAREEGCERRRTTGPRAGLQARRLRPRRAGGRPRGSPSQGTSSPAERSPRGRITCTAATSPDLLAVRLPVTPPDLHDAASWRRSGLRCTRCACRACCSGGQQSSS
jgi:hypothetical protein